MTCQAPPAAPQAGWGALAVQREEPPLSSKNPGECTERERERVMEQGGFL